MRKKTLEKRTIDDGFGKDPQEVVFDTVIMDNNETVHVIEVLPIELEGEEHHIISEEDGDQSQNQRIIFVPQNDEHEQEHYNETHSNTNSVDDGGDEKHVEFKYHYQSDDNNTQSSTEYTNEDGTSIRIISIKKEYIKHDHSSGGEEHYETDFTSTKNMEYIEVEEEQDEQGFSNRRNVKNKTNKNSNSKDVEEDHDTARNKKLSHNKLEKTRRDDLKACLDQLKALVPLEESREKFTTVSLLRKTKMLIAKLEEKEKSNLAFKGELMKEQSFLRKRLTQAKLENVGISNDDASATSSTSISGSTTSSSSSSTSSSALLSSRLTDSGISKSQKNIKTTTTATTTPTSSTSITTTATMNSSSRLNNNTNKKPKPVQPVNYGHFSTSLPQSQLYRDLLLQNSSQVLPPHTKVKTPPILKRKQQQPLTSPAKMMILSSSSPCTTNSSYSSSNTSNTITNMSTTTSSANTISTTIENQNPEIVYIEAPEFEGETIDGSNIEGDNDTYIVLSLND